jgi:hypothetical protein
MNVEIGDEAALFPEKYYLNGIAVAVCGKYSQRPRILETVNGRTCVQMLMVLNGIEIYSRKGQLEETCSCVAQCTLRHKLGRCKLSSLLATIGEVC